MTYRDRGMQKWQGMILSEHTKQLEQAKIKLSWLPQQSEECLVQILSNAVTKQRALTIQRLTKDEDGYPLPFVIVHSRILRQSHLDNSGINTSF